VRFLPPPLWLAPSFFRLKCGVEKALFFLLFVMMGAIPFDLQASLSFKKKDRFFCSVRFDVIWLAVRVPLELGSRRLHLVLLSLRRRCNGDSGWVGDAFAFSNLPPVLMSLLERRISINSTCLLSWLQFFLRRIGCNVKLEAW